MKLSHLFVVGSLLIAATASAQSVKLKKAWDKVDEENKEVAARIKEKCGVDIAIKVDQKSFDTQESVESPARWCGSGIASVLPNLCEDADYKAAVVKNVKSVMCVRDTKLGRESKDNYGTKFSLKGGVFEARYHENSANLDEYARKFLKDNL